MAKKSNGAAEVIERLPVDQVVEATENTRRTSWGNLDELAQSIREQGQITAGVVRPIGPGRFELVVGARRFRAVQLAGLPFFRTEVREMDDAAAHETRMVENNQREDVSPLEEAEAFRVAKVTHGRSVEEIAARLGRTPAYVYQRLRLLELAPDVRALLEQERIGIDSALLLAQYDPKIQAEVGARLRGWGNRRLAKADVVDAIDDVSYRLEHAPFDVADAQLVEGVPACTSCPKRTGTQGTLFDVAEADLCLDTACYDVKVTALGRKTLDRAKADGCQVIEGKAAEQVVASHGGLKHDAPYVELDNTSHYDGEGRAVTWREVLGPEVKPTIAVSPTTGKVLELAPSDVARQALSARDPKLGKQAQREHEAEQRYAADAASSNDKWKEEQRKAAEKAKIEADARRRAMAALVASVETPGDSPEDRAALQRAFVGALMQGTWADTLNEVCKRRSWSLEDAATGKKITAPEAITREMTEMNAGQVAALAVEIVATRTQNGWAGQQSGFETLCKVRNIDIEHHEREAKKAAREKAKEKAARAKEKERAAGKGASKKKSRAELDEEEAEARREQMEDAYA